MTWFRFRSQAARDMSGAMVQSGTGQVYDVDDTAFTTPLPVRDPISGAVASTVTIVDYATPEFEVDGHVELYWKSGSSPAVSIVSVAGLAAQAAAAAAAASGPEAIVEWTDAAGWPARPSLAAGQYVRWDSWRIVPGDSATDADVRAAPVPAGAVDYDRWRRHPAAPAL